MTTRLSFPAIALLATASLAPRVEAQTFIGPFIGTDSDSFETQTAFSLDPCIIERVFSNQADLCTPMGSFATIDSSMVFACTLLPNSGGFLYGSEMGLSELTFDTPVSRFGAYFASNSGDGGVRALFYDCLNNFIGFGDLLFPGDCNWYWAGWEAPVGTPFGRVELIGNYNPSFGGFLQLDDMQADFDSTCGPSGPGAKQCLGDGVDNICPCGNNNDGSGARANAAGCANSAFSSGCNLDGSGSSSIAANDAVLCFDGAVPGQIGLLFGGTIRISVPFGDGIRCCGGNTRRLQLIVADATGAGCSSVSLSGLVGALPGDQWCYQYWYRDPAGPCGSAFNLSNGYKITWTP